MSEQASIIVRLARREYDCLECRCVHAYTEPLFDLHRMSALDSGRWIYEEIKE
jgi:hypothetical protein